jgi:hypothetical protein
MVERGGFEQINSLVLRRHMLRQRDSDYAAFMQTLLSPDDWAYQ